MSEESKYQGLVAFKKVNVDKASDVARVCGVSAMPTFKVYQNGEEVGSLQGWQEANLKALIAEVIQKKN
jgi:thioredoxin 1